jgi:glycine amidinotransferase
VGIERAAASTLPVSSFTEWGPLLEVIVGEVDNGHVPLTADATDLSYRLFYGANVPAKGAAATGLQLATVRRYATRVAEERREDVEGFVALLEGLGITVKRPQRLETIAPVATPDWSSLTSFAHNIRDQCLIVGDEIIETPPLCRHRYFENDLLKPLFMDYFERGARWTVAPRPRMLDGSFDRPGDGAEARSARPEIEIMFDAAQCLRFGTDIVMNVATEHHRLGARWLQRHLGERFTVHVMDGVAADHLDVAMMPLRPGVLLVNANRLDGRDARLPRGLSSWDVINCFDTDATAYAEDELLLASEQISSNVLSLGEDRVVVNEDCTNTIRALEQHGFTAIPVRLRYSRLYGGGFHCITLDVRRDEPLETYL